MRAQRLSASLDSAPAEYGFPSAVSNRAQRLSASLDSALPCGRLHGGCLCRVLNAFRHHWIRHTITGATNATPIVCSTPFGITGFGTQPHYGRPQRHPAGYPPFGITGFGTQPHRLVASGQARCAQRLSASLDSAPPVCPEIGSCKPVLNAFRHHWIRHRGRGTRP